MAMGLGELTLPQTVQVCLELTIIKYILSKTMSYSQLAGHRKEMVFGHHSVAAGDLDGWVLSPCRFSHRH